MKLKYSIFILIFLSYLFSASCKKEKIPPANIIIHNNYSIKNPLDRPVSFDIYTSGLDYYAGTNIFLHGTVPANSDYVIPYSNLDSEQAYAIDWYYSDYTNSNWMNFFTPINDSTLVVQTLAFDSNSVYHIHLQNPDNFWRLVLLDGGKSSTRWKAVDARTDMASSSIWSQLSNFQQYFEIVFSRNYQCMSYTKDSITGALSESSSGLYLTASPTEVHVLGGGGFNPFFSTKPITANNADTFWAKVQNRYYALLKEE